MKIKANGIDVEVEDTGAGSPERPVVMLLMGLGAQLVAWPPAMIEALVNAGYRVIRPDNRDIGLSQHFDHLGEPSVIWATLKQKLGLALTPPYSLKDMAADALGVLDALGVGKAHVVGASMGGMISQRVAIAAPERVLSLTSVMSSSGAPGLPAIKPALVRAAMKRPARTDRQSLVDHYAAFYALIASPGFRQDDGLRERIGLAMDRSHHPAGRQRQTLAVLADLTRADELAQVKAPTLVIHGKADPLIPFPCGEDTARRIRGAKFVGVDGMGHDLPPGVVARILEALLPHLSAAR